MPSAWNIPLQLFTRLTRVFQSRYARTDIYRYLGHVVMSIILGLVAGLAGVLFHTLLEWMRRAFEIISLLKFDFYDIDLIFVIPVLGGVIIAGMTRLFPDIAREKDVLSVIKSILLRDGKIPIKTTIFHFIAPIISIGSGAPLGPEGPAAKIGSGVGSYLSQLLRLGPVDMRMYASAGAGAAIAAVFNAPIAGVFFGIEVILMNDLKNQALSALIISSVVADVISRALLGNHHVFLIPAYSTGPISEYPFYLVLGILCGFLSLLFFWLRRCFRHLYNNTLKLENAWLRLLPVTLLFGIILIEFHQLYGIGYSAINDVLAMKFPLEVVFLLLLLKIVFVCLFLEAGSYGGVFAPSLMMGVLLGCAFACTVNAALGTSLSPVTFALVGMGGVLAGINSMPLTSVLLVFEVTNDYRFVLPLMLVSVIAYLVVVYVNHGTAYSNDLLLEGIDVSKRGEIDLLGKIKVADLKRIDYDTIDYRTPFPVLVRRLLDSIHGDICVINDRQRLLGVISLNDIRQAITSMELSDLLIAGDLINRVPTVTDPDPVSVAIQRLEEYHLQTIPVVMSAANPTLTGILTHRDILHAYSLLLEKMGTDQYLVNYSSRKK